MVPVFLKFSTDMKMRVNIIYPIGTKSQCESYVKSVRDGAKDKLMAEIEKWIMKRIRAEYGLPGFIAGFTFNGSVALVVTAILTTAILIWILCLYIKKKFLGILVHIL